MQTSRPQPRTRGWLATIIAIYITQPNRSATAARMVRLMQAVRRRGTLGRALSLMLERRVQTRFRCFVSRLARISPDLAMPHPVGIVIGEGVEIGARCTIFQNVTLGAARVAGPSNARYPILEDDVTVFAGAVIVGSVRIGKGAMIGANSVVLHDVPAGAVAVGSPARVVRRQGEAGAEPTTLQ